MKRTLLSTLVVTSALGISSNVNALGMGELDLKSALNQPLEAEIELLNIEDLSDWEIKPTLASEEEFDRAGVERLFFLTDIDFTIKGNKVILKTNKPVTEPFLNFLVQVNWPSGRVLREYTLLLDPPVFDEEVQPLNAAAPLTQPSQVVETQAVVPAKTSNRWETEEAAPGTYKVQPNDTLWEIAVNTRPDRSVTPQQMMLAIQEENPNAFIGGNINRLKTHQVLRIPTEQQVAGVGLGEAVAEVKRQNDALTGSAQLDATTSAAESAQTNQLADGGELKLLSDRKDVSDSAGASGDVESGSADGGRREGVENDLAIALETLDKSKLENNELKERLASLEEQIATLQKLVSLKDDQLATIQTLESQSDDSVAEVATEADVAEGAEATAVAETDVVAEPVTDELAEDAVAEGGEELDFNYAETEQPQDELAGVAETDATVDVAEQPLAQDAAQVQQDAALVAQQVQQDAINRYRPKSFVDQLLAKPEWMAGLGGGVLAIIAGIAALLKRRKKAAAEGEIEDPELAAYGDNFEFGDEDLDDVALDDIDLEDGEGLEDELNDDLLEGIGGEADVDVDVEAELEGEAETVAQTSDIIGEADIYIAYGRFDQAIDLLKNSIDAEPSRTDLRLKLLEVFVETDDANAFAEAESGLVALGDAESTEKAGSLRQRLSGPIAPAADEMVADIPELAPEADGLESLDDAGDDFADGLDFEAALDLTDGEDDGQIEELSEESQDFAAALDSLDDLAADEEDNGLEFDLSDDEIPELAADEELPELTDEEDFSEDALEFELPEESLDLSADEVVEEESPLDLEAAEEASLEQLDEALEDDGLDFDLSADLDQAEESVPELSLDDDLAALDSAEDELPVLDSEDKTDGELDSFDVGLDTADLGETLAAEDDTVVELAAVDEQEEDGLSDLESLLDSDEESEGGLPDLDFEMEGDTGFSAEDSADDLQALESELGELAAEADLEEVAEEVAPEIADIEEPIVEDAAEDVIEAANEESLDDLAAELDELTADDLTEAAEEAASEFDLDDLDDVPSFEEAIQQKAVEEAAPVADAAPAADGEIDLDQLAASEDEFDFLAGTDECATKLDLARAYIDMEDVDGAKELLQEVVAEGSDQQKQDARSLLDSLG